MYESNSSFIGANKSKFFDIDRESKAPKSRSLSKAVYARNSTFSLPSAVDNVDNVDEDFAFLLSVTDVVDTNAPLTTLGSSAFRLSDGRYVLLGVIPWSRKI